MKENRIEKIEYIICGKGKYYFVELFLAVYVGV